MTGPRPNPTRRRNAWRHSLLDQEALDLIERDLIVAPVAEPGGASTLVVGHLLGDLKSTAIAQVLHDPGSLEGVVPDFGGHISLPWLI